MEKKYIYITTAVVVILGVGSILTYRQINKNKDSKEGKTEDDETDGSVVVKPTDFQDKNIIGKQVRTHPTLGYTNVRSTAKVDDGYFGLGSNKIGEVKINPIGVVTGTLAGEDKFTWYIIRLTTPIDGKTTGFVREDAVSF